MATKYQGTSAEQSALDLFIKLMRVQAAVESQLYETLSAIDLNPSQFGILETLYHLGPLQQHELATKLLKSAGNITRVLDSLQERGMIERATEPGDRRCFRIHLTTAGKKFIGDYFPTFAKKIDHIFSGLDKKEQAQLNDLLRKLGKNQTYSLNMNKTKGD